MKRLAFAMAVAGGPVFALRRLVPKLPAMRAHCHGIAVTGGGIPI